jgi:hypothetical protein
MNAASNFKQGQKGGGVGGFPAASNGHRPDEDRLNLDRASRPLHAEETSAPWMTWTSFADRLAVHSEDMRHVMAHAKNDGGRTF